MRSQEYRLTDEQLEYYIENGFLVMAPVFDEEELIEFRLAADELLAESGPIVNGNPRLEIEPETHHGKLVVRKIEPVIDVVPVLKALANDTRLIALVAQIFGEPAILFEDKLNYKPPHVGSAYLLHQDYSYWQKYTDQLITVVLYLDEATVENGCLRFVPGSHKQRLMKCQSGSEHFIEMEDPSIAIDAPGKAGSLVLFSCYTAHHSYPNTSEKGRRALLFTYNSTSDGDTYPVYKGKHAQRCQAWLKLNSN